MKLFLALASSLVRRGYIRSIGCWLLIGVAFILYGIITALDQSFSATVTLSTDNQLIVAHRHSRQQALPIAYLNKILSVNGVKDVGPRLFFGGWYQTAEQGFAQYIIDPKRDVALQGIEGISLEQQQLFLSGGNGVLVGRQLADRFNWRIGQRIRLTATNWPQPDGSEDWDFVIAGIYSNQGDSLSDSSDTMLIARDYFLSKVPYASNIVGWFLVEPGKGVDPNGLASAIDSVFEHEAEPTLTTSARAYAMYMYKQFGELSQLSMKIAFAVFVSLVLSTSLFFLQNVSENRAQFAMLYVLGVSMPRIIMLVLLGTIIFCVPPSVMGLFLAWLGTPFIAREVGDFLPGVIFPWTTFISGLIVALSIAVVSALLVYVAIRRYTIADLRDE